MIDENLRREDSNSNKSSLAIVDYLIAFMCR